MNAIKVGNVDIEEIPGAKLMLKRGEAGILTRPYKGSVDDLAAFIAANNILTTDYQFPSMVLDEIDATWDGVEGGALLTYYGLPAVNAGNAGELQTDMSWEPRSARLTTNQPTTDGDWDVNYYCPTITFRYAISAALNLPQYQNAAVDISDITILDQTIAPPFAAPPSGLPQGNFLYQTVAACTSFKRNQRGNIYNYAETWGTLIQKPGTKNKGIAG